MTDESVINNSNNNILCDGETRTKNEVVKGYVIIDSDSPEKNETENSAATDNDEASQKTVESYETSSVVTIHVENLNQTLDETESSGKENNVYDEEHMDRSVSPRSSAVDNVNDLFNTNPDSEVISDDDDDDHTNLNSSSHYTSSLVDDECLHNQVIILKFARIVFKSIVLFTILINISTCSH